MNTPQKVPSLSNILISFGCICKCQGGQVNSFEKKKEQKKESPFFFPKKQKQKNVIRQKRKDFGLYGG